MILKTNILAVIVTTSFFFFSCNKDGAGCFDKAGETKTVTVDLSAFKSIDVSTNVDVKLLTTGADKVEVTTGENLLSGISLTVEDSVLKIKNLNSCFWSRGYVNPLVSIKNVNLSRVIQHGYGQIYSVDTLKIDKLFIQVEDASGEVDLIIDANYVRVVSNNIGPITLFGKTKKLNITHSWSDGILYAKELNSENCSINHNGSNRIEVNVKNVLSCKIGSLGNVFLYKQKPAEMNISITGDGNIIEKY